MRYKHVGVKVVIDAYGDLIIDPSLVESLFKTHSNRKIRPHLGTSAHRVLPHAPRFFA
jgi:hypothetical protein